LRRPGATHPGADHGGGRRLRHDRRRARRRRADRAVAGVLARGAARAAGVAGGRLRAGPHPGNPVHAARHLAHRYGGAAARAGGPGRTCGAPSEGCTAAVLGTRLAGGAMSALLSISNLTVRFGGLCALNGFSMDVEEGSIHALIGPNGAGKSTVFNCISRFCQPADGDIAFAGTSVLVLPAHDVVKTGIGRTFQNLELLHRMTVLENVLIGLTRRVPRYFPFAPSPRRSRIEAQAVRAADEILEQTGLKPYRDQLAGELDFGRQKLLDLARALAGSPKLLLLDEPAAGLRNREISFVDSLLLDLV